MGKKGPKFGPWCVWCKKRKKQFKPKAADERPDSSTKKKI
jgi:hypothetical protein